MKTAEELAEEERQRLEALEAQRLKRMRAGPDAEEADLEGGNAPLLTGGYAARRQKRQRQAQKAETGPSGTACFALLLTGSAYPITAAAWYMTFTTLSSVDMLISRH